VGGKTEPDTKGFFLPEFLGLAISGENASPFQTVVEALHGLLAT